MSEKQISQRKSTFPPKNGGLYIWVLLLVFLCVVPAVTAQLKPLDQQDDKETQTLYHWDELMHYAMIANFELAKGHGLALLELNPNPVQLLDLAESDRYGPSYRNLGLMRKNTPIRDVAAKILAMVEKGRFLRRTDTQRIKAEVKRLSGTTRGRILALERLKDSGEWAVPIMIEALRDRDRSDEISVIRWAMPQLGQSAVNPLLTALRQCKDLNIKLIVLDVLGRIGYKQALPYIRRIIQDDRSDVKLKNAAIAAFRAIDPGSADSALSAAALFEQLAMDFYDHLPSLAVPADQDHANIWFWNDQDGLFTEQLPRDAFDELMTMRCCEFAAELDAGRTNAISLWLSAFFRLEAQGHKQPDYFGQDHPDAGTYALTAGPEYLHRVLDRALKNRNQPVALSAIHTLQRNSGQQSLLYELDAAQPLIGAMSFPDRQVRFSAALALAGAMPLGDFEQSDLVVPTIAQTLRQKGHCYAIVVTPRPKQRNNLASQLREKEDNFRDVVADEFFSGALERSRHAPSLDLIVLADDIVHPNLSEALNLISNDYRMAFCPTIVLSNLRAAPNIKKLQKDNPFMQVVPAATPVDDILKIARAIPERNQARLFAADLADQYATQAAVVLERLAMTRNPILPLKKAESALIEALYDQRGYIQKAAVRTLARMDSTPAQRAVAKLAIEKSTEIQMRTLAFRNLSVSAKNFGNLLSAGQVDAIYDLIVGSLNVDDQLRNVAAQAYGSLNLPSARISKLILRQSSSSSR